MSGKKGKRIRITGLYYAKWSGMVVYMDMKMRELEVKTGVSRETIRYYIREGIVPEPERPKRNVALYGKRHVVRIRAIKQLQEQKFLPLAMIRKLLESESAGEMLDGGGIQGVEYLLPGLLHDVEYAKACSIAELTEDSVISAQEIRELAAAGVIRIGDDDQIDTRDVAIIEQWARLRENGYEPSEGFSIAFLRLYQRLTRKLARREIDVFVKAYQARLDSGQAARRVADGLGIVNTILNLMHTKCVIEEFQRVFTDPGKNESAVA